MLKFFLNYCKSLVITLILSCNCSGISQNRYVREVKVVFPKVVFPPLTVGETVTWWWALTVALPKKQRRKTRTVSDFYCSFILMQQYRTTTILFVNGRNLKWTSFQIEDGWLSYLVGWGWSWERCRSVQSLELVNDLKAAGNTVTKNLVGNTPCCNGLKSCNANKVPLLKKVHIQFNSEHVDNSENAWGKTWNQNWTLASTQPFFDSDQTHTAKTIRELPKKHIKVMQCPIQCPDLSYIKKSVDGAEAGFKLLSGSQET